jgi:hypothetical protein
MALSKIQASSINLADTFTFTGNISGTSDVALLSTITLGNQGNANFTGIGSDYDMYMWHLSDIDVSANTMMWLRYSLDGGSTYNTTGGNYEYAVRGYRSNNEFGTAPSTSDSKIQITFGGAVIDDDDNHNFSGVVYMTSHTNSNTRCNFWWHLGYVSGDSGYATGIYGAGSIRAANHNPNAIQFLPQSGNFSSGKIKMYGWK